MKKNEYGAALLVALLLWLLRKRPETTTTTNVNLCWIDPETGVCHPVPGAQQPSPPAIQ